MVFCFIVVENKSAEGKEETNVEMTGNKIQLNQQKSPTTGNFELMSFGPIHRNSKILTLDPELTRWQVFWGIHIYVLFNESITLE